jgi:hypothetical protein
MAHERGKIGDDLSESVSLAPTVSAVAPKNKT